MLPIPPELRLYVYAIYRWGLRKRQLERILRFPVKQKGLYGLPDIFVIGLREENFRWEFTADRDRGCVILWVSGRAVSYERGKVAYWGVDV